MSRQEGRGLGGVEGEGGHYGNLFATPISKAMHDEASVNMCWYIFTLCSSSLPSRRCNTKATNLNLKHLFFSTFSSFHLIVIPLVSEKFNHPTSLYFSYHVTSEQNISPEPEMVYWQRLTANPDQRYKVFCQTGSCSVHIYRLLDCLQWDKMSHIFVEPFFSTFCNRNKNLKWIISESLLLQIKWSINICEKL